MRKLKRVLSLVSATVMSGICVLSNLTTVSAVKEKYGLGAVESSQAEWDDLYSQFENSACSIDFNNISNIPTACDLSTNEDSIYFPPIGHQGDISSCTAWATTYYQYTYAANKYNGIESNENTAYSPSWTYNFNSINPKIGISVPNAYKLLKAQGALTMAEMPYDKDNYSFDWSNNTSAMVNALRTRVSNCGEIDIDSEGTPIKNKNAEELKKVKKALSLGYVLVVCSDADKGLTNWSFKKRYNSNENVAYRSSTANEGHALAVVGYNDNVCCDVNGNNRIEDSERGAFKVANSWGNTWSNGNNGFIWVLYDALNAKTANTSNTWEKKLSGTRTPIFKFHSGPNRFNYIEVKHYDVNMAGLLTVNTNHKHNFSVDLLKNNKNSDNNATAFSYLNIFKDSAQKSFNGSLVFDYTDTPVITATRGNYFGVRISNLNTEIGATLSYVSFKIVDDKLNVIKKIANLPNKIYNNNDSCKMTQVKCKKGDINYDNKLDSIDISFLLEYNLQNPNLDFSTLQYYLADYDNNGVVELVDYSLLCHDIANHNTSNKNELNKIASLNKRMINYMKASSYTIPEISDIVKLNESIQNHIDKCVDIKGGTNNEME